MKNIYPYNQITLLYSRNQTATCACSPAPAPPPSASCLVRFLGPRRGSWGLQGPSPWTWLSRVEGRSLDTVLRSSAAYCKQENHSWEILPAWGTAGRDPSRRGAKGSSWVSNLALLPGTVSLLALKVLHPGRPLSPGQTRGWSPKQRKMWPLSTHPTLLLCLGFRAKLHSAGVPSLASHK